MVTNFVVGGLPHRMSWMVKNLCFLPNRMSWMVTNLSFLPNRMSLVVTNFLLLFPQNALGGIWD